MSDTWLGQIRTIHGKWVDYARGQEAESRKWQAADPENRRVVDWIHKDRILVPAQVDTTGDVVVEAENGQLSSPELGPDGKPMFRVVYEYEGTTESGQRVIHSEHPTSDVLRLIGEFVSFLQAAGDVDRVHVEWTNFRIVRTNRDGSDYVSTRPGSSWNNDNYQGGN